MESNIQADTEMPVSQSENLRIVAWCEPESEELERAYNTLPGGSVAFHITGEVWHYLGTGQTAEGTYIHSFRHRCHPYTNKRMYRSVKASPSWAPAPTEVRRGRA